MSLKMRELAAVRARQRGISMAEALVALLVMSIGMLGIAGLYVTSLQANRTALLRTQAVTLVNDMIDRIRANPMARDKYDLTAAYGDNPVSQDCVAGEKNCSVDKLAQDDLYRWKESVKAILPGAPTVKVTYTAAASATLPDNYVVQVTWAEPGETGRFSYTGTLNMISVQP
jgi:type IV pilus assembly protein PilV